MWILIDEHRMIQASDPKQQILLWKMNIYIYIYIYIYIIHFVYEPTYFGEYIYINKYRWEIQNGIYIYIYYGNLCQKTVNIYIYIYMDTKIPPYM